MNSVTISNSVIDNYKNNTEILKELKVRLQSGSGSIYDISLYNALKREKKLVKKLNK